MANGLLGMLLGQSADPWAGMRQQGAQTPGSLGGFNPLESLRQFSQNNPGVLGQIGAGMMAGDAAGGFANAGELQARNREKFMEKQETQRKTNLTRQWLIKNRGMSEEDADMAMSSPEILNSYLKTPESKLTDDMREYQMAVGQGFNGSFMDYQVKMKEAGRNQVNIDTGVKLPSGYRWVDPNKQELGVEPIPGGPGEQIPGELAARVGMADSFLGQLPDIKQKVATGQVTGPWDRSMAVMGHGEQASVYRQIESGVDALMRLLTGAGMNQTEAAAYARRYLPTYADDTAAMGQKLDQLAQELTAAKNMAMRGRGGGQTVPPQSGAANDPLGIR